MDVPTCAVHKPSRQQQLWSCPGKGGSMLRAASAYWGASPEMKVSLNSQIVTGESTRCTFDSSTSTSRALWHSCLTSCSFSGSHFFSCSIHLRVRAYVWADVDVRAQVPPSFEAPKSNPNIIHGVTCSFLEMRRADPCVRWLQPDRHAGLRTCPSHCCSRLLPCQRYFPSEEKCTARCPANTPARPCSAHHVVQTWKLLCDQAFIPYIERYEITIRLVWFQQVVPTSLVVNKHRCKVVNKHRCTKKVMLAQFKMR